MKKVLIYFAIVIVVFLLSFFLLDAKKPENNYYILFQNVHYVDINKTTFVNGEEEIYRHEKDGVVTITANFDDTVVINDYNTKTLTVKCQGHADIVVTYGDSIAYPTGPEEIMLLNKYNTWTALYKDDANIAPFNLKKAIHKAIAFVVTLPLAFCIMMLAGKQNVADFKAYKDRLLQHDEEELTLEKSKLYKIIYLVLGIIFLVGYVINIVIL